MKKWSEKQLKKFYREQYPINEYYNALHEAMYGFIWNLKTSSAFEFGCNVGKNLKQLNIPKVSGIDISQRAIDNALVDGLMCGDEKTLKDVPSDSYELVFTCSVLCHIHDVDGIIAELQRTSSNHVLLVESQCNDFDNHFPHDYSGEVAFTEKTVPGKAIEYNGYYLAK